MKILILFSKTVFQSYQLDSRAPVVFKDTDFKAGVGNYKIPIRPTSETS
jgi:hypothetical protein